MSAPVMVVSQNTVSITEVAVTMEKAMAVEDVDSREPRWQTVLDSFNEGEVIVDVIRSLMSILERTHTFWKCLMICLIIFLVIMSCFHP
ncbi:unnamed protein product [Vicia faba]|uniref:Uncharacterized protein n=1 Tax=Vicia faba TaxID=3906 RepID=A0AAV1ABH9_VICFA|nr:unnamed protein product [Vicia faba]